MEILPIHLNVLRSGDDLASQLCEAHRFEEGDIVVVSSKAVATVEGAAKLLTSFTPTEEAKRFAKETRMRTPAFVQAVLEETIRLNGTVEGTCLGTLITEVRPNGLKRGSILTANAGLDESNVEEGYAIGWPMDPVQSVRELWHRLSASLSPLSPRPFPHRGKGDAPERFSKPPINRTILKHARSMRQKATDAEAKLWNAVRLGQLGVHYRHQHPIGNKYILDFYCHEARLGIEVDGSIHDTADRRELDVVKQKEVLEGHGIRIIRFSNEQVLDDLPSVLRNIRDALHFSPPPACPPKPWRRRMGKGSGVGEVGRKIAVILSDSCCHPRRLGMTAFALACAGFDPLLSQMGREDLFGKKLHITTEAIADQLATAANFCMGNANQSIPAAVIRHHGIPFEAFCGWVEGIEPTDDMFRDILRISPINILK